MWAIQVCAAVKGLKQGIIFQEIGQLVEDFLQTRDCGIRVCFGQTVLVASVVLENSYSRIGGTWGVYSSIGQQNSAELALVQVKGCRVPVAHSHPEIPKVPPPPPHRDFDLFLFSVFQGLLLVIVIIIGGSEKMIPHSHAKNDVFSSRKSYSFCRYKHSHTFIRYCSPHNKVLHDTTKKYFFLIPHVNQTITHHCFIQSGKFNSIS